MTPGHVDNGNFLLAHYKWAWARNFFKPHFLLSPTPVCGTKSMFQLFENQPSLLSVIRHPCVMIWRRKKQFYPTPTSVKCSSCFVLVLVTHLIQSLVLCVCSYSNLVLQWICLQWHIQVVNHRTIHTLSLPFHIASCTYIQIAGPKSIYTAPPSSLITIVIITQIILIAQMQRAVQYGAPYLI